MGKTDRFEDLIAWQKSRLLTCKIYQIVKKAEFSKDFASAAQITKAAVSTMSNIAEGFERGKRGDFEHFPSIANGSCAEERSQLYVALDVGYLQQVDFDSLLHQAEEVGKIIGGLRASVARQRKSR